jgi:hypothetical protein
MKHPEHHDRGYRQGEGGIVAPSEYMTAAEAVEHATTHVIEAQLRVIERLTAENTELRRELGRRR